jgi:hypothetical protein
LYIRKVDPKKINLVLLNTPDRNEQTVSPNSGMKVYSINAYGDMIQESGSNAFDFNNGIYPDNTNAEIFYEDQNTGPCDYSNHCPSDANTAVWLPILKQNVNPSK